MREELPSFAAPRQSIDWARKAIEELDGILARFFREARTEQVTEPDPESACQLLKIKLVGIFPPENAEQRATEALGNLRNSFDQSLFAACAAINRAPKKDVHFPWRMNPNDLEAVFRGKKNEIAPEFWDTIREQEPYPKGEGYSGGDSVIREIARIANRKHTVGIALMSSISNFSYDSLTSAGPITRLDLLGPNWDPVKNEMVVARYMAADNPKLSDDYRIAFNPVFSDTRLDLPISMVGGLALFLNKAECVLKSLETRAIELLN